MKLNGRKIRTKHANCIHRIEHLEVRLKDDVTFRDWTTAICPAGGGKYLVPRYRTLV